MIRINLLPAAGQAEARAKAPGLLATVPLVALCAVIGALALVSVLQSARIRSLRTEVGGLEVEARELAPLIQRIGDLTRERELTLRRLGVIAALDQNRLVRVRMVDELARRLPAHMWLTGFSEQGGAVAVSGVTFSNLTVAELIRSLEQSVLYEQVDLVKAERGAIDGREVVNFTLSARRQAVEEGAAGAIEPAGRKLEAAPVPAPAAAATAAGSTPPPAGAHGS